MTRDEIMNLSDEELNAMVATEVMGLTIYKDAYNDYSIQIGNEQDGITAYQPIPRYTSDIAAAMEVAYEMNARNCWFMCGVLSTYCYAQFGPSETNRIFKFEAGVNELPRAISIAALLAVMQP